MNKAVFFLGAGATIDVVPGAPSNKDLVKKALEDFKETPEGKEIWYFVDDLFHQREFPPTDNQIWNLLDFIVQQGKSASLKYNLERIVELRNSLLNLVIKEFKRSLNPETTPINTYDNFARLIATSHSSIISTNYDIFIDNALVKNDCFDYGAKLRLPVFVSSSARLGFSVKGFRRATEGGETRLNTGNIKLLKIHGSLNWLYCRKCDEVDITMGEKFEADALKELHCVHNYCTNKYEPLLITPTMFKNYENRIIKETWDCAEKELIDADNLVFIGYALKDEDYQIRCLLMKALLNKKKNYQKVIVIDKKPDNNDNQVRLEENIGNKYRDLYGNGVVRFETIGFTEFVNKISEFDLGLDN